MTNNHSPFVGRDSWQRIFRYGAQAGGESDMCHSFIIGDLVVDHTIFVKDTTADHQPKANENIYQVLRRTDTAGGAANCARILASLSDGETYLWGIMGKSHWGHFRSILSHAQAVDGSTKAIELRGVADETDGQMNTISRLILQKSGTRGEDAFRDRFDEHRHLHVTPEKRKTVLHYLERAGQKLKEQNKGHLDVIVINDLDYGCLTREIVTEIAEFARRRGIPLFVDPKYDAEKYRHITGTAILPNLTEWCRLVGQRENETEWRARVRQSRDLSEMAYLCFSVFGDFKYYIITCDQDGIVFIGPSMEEQDRYIVCNLPPHTQSSDSRLDQLGSGDVLTAVFAMELDRISRMESSAQNTKNALKALMRASVVVACYREMPWHHMPSQAVVKKALGEAERDLRYKPLSETYIGRPKAHPRIGIKYLPKSTDILLSEYKTIVPGWFSQNQEFCEQLQKVVADCVDTGWAKHIVLGAPSGSGKTDFCKFLRSKVEHAGIVYSEASSAEDIQAQIDEHLARKQSATVQRLVVVDEALKHGFQELGFALDKLELCKDHSVRLLLIDTGFFHGSPLAEQKYFEFKRRVNEHFFMPPSQRPFDIPLIIAGVILERCPSVEIRGDFLLAFICALLQTPSVGHWKPEIHKTVSAALAARPWEGRLTLSDKHVSEAIRKLYLEDRASHIAASTKFTFSRGPGWPLQPTGGIDISEAKNDAA